MFCALPVPVVLVFRRGFGEFRGEQVEVVRAGLGVDGQELGLGVAGVGEGEARRHVDEEERGGGQGCERDGAVGRFGFGDLRARRGVEFGEGVAAGEEAFGDPGGWLLD